MRSCTVCGGRGLRAASYKVRGEDGVLAAFPGLQCHDCGRIQPDNDAIVRMVDVPRKLRERCHEVSQEVRIVFVARGGEEDGGDGTFWHPGTTPRTTTLPCTAAPPARDAMDASGLARGGR